ncbi:MAG: adenine deaminase [Alphaproteobacteria bacterium]
MKMAKKLSPSLSELNGGIQVASGKQQPDMLIKNVTWLDILNGTSEVTNVAVHGRFIAGIGKDYTTATKIIDATNLYIVPGFIDTHVHIESSMMTPFEFKRKTLSKGTTTAICDPHEITNVLNSTGFEWILRCSEKMHQNLFVQVSSCVPAAENFETNGGVFSKEHMVGYKNHPNVLGMAEMMNMPGVINGDEKVLEKIMAFSDTIIDGHAPTLRGQDLNAYRFAGIANCHESITLEEAKEKLAYGMGIMLREGSAAKNLSDLIGILREFNAHNCMLCSDDRNPLDISEEGHIDYMVRKLINKHQVPPHTAYAMASYSAARHFGLDRLGLVAPGYQADFLLISDLKTVKIEKIFCKGIEHKETEFNATLAQEQLSQTQAPVLNTINIPDLSVNDLEYNLTEAQYRVIKIIPNQIITEEIITTFKNDKFDQNDILPIQVIERYGHKKPPSKGLVHGFGLKEGAIATSVAHDSHNIIVVGEKSQDRLHAILTLQKMGGGIVIVKDGEVLASLALPIAGLMSYDSAENITKNLKHLRNIAKTLGCAIKEPFLQLSFLALPVIPTLKITDCGLVYSSGTSLEVVSLKV